MKLRKNVKNIVLKLWKYCPKNGTKTMKKFVEKIGGIIVQKIEGIRNCGKNSEKLVQKL